MNISEPFIRRPIATSLFMAAIALFGVIAYIALPVNDLPNVDYPTVVVNASLPGADPETMSSAVATPLERVFSSIPGLDSISSNSSLGSTRINLQFDLNRNIDAAAQDVQSAINQASKLLPADMPNPPSVLKVNPTEEFIVAIGLTSPTLPITTLTHYAEVVVAPNIGMISGVASLNLRMETKAAIRIQVDPSLLANNKIGINEVEKAVRDWNVNLPAGELDGPKQNFTLKSNGRLLKVEDFQSVIVAYRNGSPVRLRDLGRVVEGVENDRTQYWIVTSKGISHGINLQIQKQPGTNAIEVRDNAVEALAHTRSQLPPSVEVTTMMDHSQGIRAAFHDIQVTLALALGLVIMVIFLFLRNASATVIPSLALPFSLLGTFGVIYLFGFSLNNLSLMALILSVGFVVDDAIVMLENIMRHMEMGEKPLEAALNGSREISFTIVSMTLSLAAVFIPVLFMGGMLGRLLREFGITICVAVLISGVVSLTLTPMLASRFLRAHSNRPPGRFHTVTEEFFDHSLRIYDRSLQWVLRHRPATMVVSLGTLLATIALFIVIPKGFVPDEDTAELRVNVEATQGTSSEQMAGYMLSLARLMADDPNIRSLSMRSAGSDATGQINVHLNPPNERKKSSIQLAREYRTKLAVIPGVRITTRIPPAISVGTVEGRALYLFTMQSSNIEELYREADIFEQKMRRLPALQDVSSDLQIKKPELHVVMDRDAVAAYKLTAQDVEDALSAAYSDRLVSTIYAPDAQYKVLMEVAPEYHENQNALDLLYVKSTEGHLVPLRSVTKTTQAVGAQSVNHYGQLPAVTLSFNLRQGAALGDGVEQIQKLANTELPASITTTFQGSAATFQKSQKNLLLLLIVAILLIYIVLGILYESYIHPITILSGLPSAGLGALVTLILFRSDLNIYGFVGLIMLVGIVKKNAIIQIDFALDAERNEGKSAEEAIYQGCLVRFRPIMMTTMAALLGSLPIALGYGQGGEARMPLGLTVVGGLLFSQLITLYLTPVVYTYLAAFQERIGKRKKTDAHLPRLHEPVTPV